MAALAAPVRGPGVIGALGHLIAVGVIGTGAAAMVRDWLRRHRCGYCGAELAADEAGTCHGCHDAGLGW